jgi:DNA-binding transcriptional ArsR family regulator
MNTEPPNPNITDILLRALHQADSPCTRSELAGYAQLTIRQLSHELERLVQLGVVERVEDGVTTLYQLREWHEEGEELLPA